MAAPAANPSAGGPTAYPIPCRPGSSREAKTRAYSTGAPLLTAIAIALRIPTAYTMHCSPESGSEGKTRAVLERDAIADRLRNAPTAAAPS